MVMDSWNVDPTRPVRYGMEKQNTLHAIIDHGGTVHRAHCRGKAQTQSQQCSPGEHPPEVRHENSHDGNNRSHHSHDQKRLHSERRKTTHGTHVPLLRDPNTQRRSNRGDHQNRRSEQTLAVTSETGTHLIQRQRDVVRLLEERTLNQWTRDSRNNTHIVTKDGPSEKVHQT